MRILLCLGCDVLLILSKKAYKLIFDCLKYNRYICNKFYNEAYGTQRKSKGIRRYIPTSYREMAGG